MALKLDSNAVLRAMADHPETFLAVRNDIDVFAQKVLIKQMKDKTLNLDLLKQIHRATGNAAVATILDGLAPNEAAAVLKKLDAHNPTLGGGDARSIRAIIDDLVAGRASPTAKPEKPAKIAAPKKTTAKAPAKSKIGNILESEVHAGTMKRPRAKAAS